MKEKGLKKNPGCSWIQIGGEIHAFVAGNASHSETDEIYSILALLRQEMQLLGYVQMVRNDEILLVNSSKAVFRICGVGLVMRM